MYTEMPPQMFVQGFDLLCRGALRGLHTHAHISAPLSKHMHTRRHAQRYTCTYTETLSLAHIDGPIAVQPFLLQSSGNSDFLALMAVLVISMS